SSPFWLGLIEFSWLDPEIPRWQSALAFSIYIQILCIFLNLLPIPPFDGFNALAPWLPRHIVEAAYSFGFMSLFLVFYLFRVSAFYEPLMDQTFDILDRLQVPVIHVIEGDEFFRFWEKE